jgi:hypothetical protein
MLPLVGPIFGVDWVNDFLGADLLYPAIGKPLITLLAKLLALSIGRKRVSNRDWGLLLAAFCCMLPTDILMNLVVISPDLSVGPWTFMAGGVLSIIAHIFLIIRLAPGSGFFSNYSRHNIWLPLVIYGPALVILIILWPDVVQVGHAVIAPAYTVSFYSTMWFAWEIIRRRTLPKPIAWMCAIAATCWFWTEISGEIYNLGLGDLSDIMFRLVRVFYGSNAVL